MEQKTYFIELSKEKNHIEFSKKLNEAYKITDIVGNNYPKHFEWFWTKLVPGLFLNEREIVIAYVENIPVGVTFLKKTKDEKKICTILVLEEYRRKGIGTGLIDKSIQILETKTPLITITEKQIYLFDKIIEKYNWKLDEIKEGVYLKNIKEYIYN
ncbi:MAG: GNAT family N-acetyltransferase [Oscillospiraceae bacterium]|nr:GNAT family N-acetyltransferase [Oscillospiraceae bacterium]